MIVWSTIEASCPMCGSRSRLREVGSGFIVGQDSDLLLRMNGKHIIQAEVHTCGKCRFSGYAADFLRAIGASARKHFLEHVSPTLVDDLAPDDRNQLALGAGKTPLPDVQYRWAARTAEALGLSPGEQGERWLRAYWCLRLTPSSHLAPALKKSLRKLYLKWAIGKLRQGLRSDTNRNRVYLVGELCRRNGNFLMAVSYLRRFIDREAGAQYLKQAADKLIQLSRQRRSEEISLEELLYNQEPNARPNREDGASRDAG